ncbi:MAG: DUF4238 domain-containing protein [Archangium sp.]|nr:DUF4238 domain-containing protein [Archangium sp.]
MTERHHYLPQFIFRGFSPDGASVGALHLKSGARISHAGIKTQCAKADFYGESSLVDDCLTLMETEVARMVQAFPHFEPRWSRVLSVFVHTQFARTLAAAARLEQLEEIVGTSESREIGSPQLLALHHAFLNAEVLSDLEVRILRAPQGTAFVIGDDPVVCSNQFAQLHPRFRHLESFTGLAQKGLQVFLPVSSEFTIALFDPTTYAYPAQRTCTLNHDDVWQLNALQAMHAQHSLYFRFGETTREHLLRLREIHLSSSGWRAPSATARVARLGALESRSPRLAHCFDFAQLIAPADSSADLIDERKYEDWFHHMVPLRRVTSPS